MGFKTISQYNEDKYNGWFVLPNDQDSAHVVFLYEKPEDVMVGDVHYIKSGEYSGYVFHNESNCPVCNKGIRIQPKLFIPLYNIDSDKIEVWDRTPYFEDQLTNSVLKPFPNPSEVVFEITRHGRKGDRDTTYQIEGRARNTLTMSQILAAKNTTIEATYDSICKEFSNEELARILNSTQSSSTLSEDYNYSVTPRGGNTLNPDNIPDSTFDNMPLPESPSVELPQMSVPPADIPMPASSQDISQTIMGEELSQDDSSDPISDVKF